MLSRPVPITPTPTLHWRVSFWLLGSVCVLFALPLWRFLRRLPEHYVRNSGGPPIGIGSFFGLLRIPTLRIVTAFVAIATFGLFLVYTWLPTFLYDKFSLGMARAGFEASVYPQIGTALGLLVGGALADRFFARTKASRYWVLLAAFVAAGPCILLLGRSETLAATRLAAMGFGFFSGFVAANQAAAAFDVVPAAVRASTVGMLNLLGAGVSGFAPFLGGLARRTIGVDQLMAMTGGLYAFGALLIVYAILRLFQADYRRAQEGSAV